jgi:enoyl-CoA hydratase/carnithine racemase
MEFISLDQDREIAVIMLSRGKVNALNETLVEELHSCLKNVEKDDSIRAVILTGRGKFFSFGFDIPEFLGYSRESFTGYIEKFTALYTYLFQFPKPVVAAINGHAIAGGCMLATACDYRIMVSEKARISLNEIAFGSTVFAGSVEMLKHCVGARNAEHIFFSGAMYSAGKALELGLIDRITPFEKLMDEAKHIAAEYAGKSAQTFKSAKGLCRKPIVEEMLKREKDSIREFIEIWYSAETWKNLREIKIHS